METQTTGIDGGETCPVAGKSDAVQNRSNLFKAQDDRKFLLSRGTDESQSAPLALESMLEEEFDAAKSNGAGRTGELFDIFEVEEILAKVFFGDQIGRFLAVFGKLAHCPNVHLLSRFGQAPELQIFGHSLAEFHHCITSWV